MPPISSSFKTIWNIMEVIIRKSGHDWVISFKQHSFSHWNFLHFQRFLTNISLDWNGANYGKLIRSSPCLTIWILSKCLNWKWDCNDTSNFMEILSFDHQLKYPPFSELIKKYLIWSERADFWKAYREGLFLTDWMLSKTLTWKWDCNDTSNFMEILSFDRQLKYPPFSELIKKYLIWSERADFWWTHKEDGFLSVWILSKTLTCKSDLSDVANCAAAGTFHSRLISAALPIERSIASGYIIFFSVNYSDVNNARLDSFYHNKVNRSKIATHVLFKSVPLITRPGKEETTTPTRHLIPIIRPFRTELTLTWKVGFHWAWIISSRLPDAG